MARLQIRRSTGSSAPTSLYPGELAFSAGLDSLYIGSPVTGGLLAITEAAADGGSGYVGGDVGKVCVVSDGGGSNGSVVIKTVSGGEVTEFYTTPEAMGTGYTATTGAAISDSTTTGTGAKVTFTISSTTASLPKKIVNSTPETHTSGAKIALAEGTHYGSHEVTLASPDSLAASLTFTLPDADGSAGQFLKTDSNGNLSFDTVTQSLTISDGSSTDSVATGETLTFASTANEVETAVTNNTVTIGLPSDVTIGNDLTVTGDLNVVGAMTTIETSDVAIKDKTMVLGVAGGMEEQTYTQAGTTVTVSSSNHGFSNSDYVYISGSANTADNVYQITSVADVNTFTFTGSSSTTLSTATSIFHSSNKVTKTTGNGSGLVVPIAGGMASIKYEEATDDWGFSENIDLASGKVIKIANTEVLSATQYTGNAATTTALATARTLGGVSFDGTANINLPGVNATGNQDTSGNAATATLAATATALATARTIGGVSFDGTANINLPGVNAAGNQDTTGNAATATKLAASKTIGGVAFDGSANINLPGVNAAGNQDTTGNAATATALETARTIGGVSFDGTANINLPGVNTAGTQNTSGTAGGLSSTLAIGSGGTGLTAWAKGSVVVANTANTLSALDGGGTITSGTGFLEYNQTSDTIAWSENVDGGTF